MPISEATRDSYPFLGFLGFRNGSLIQDTADGKVYLIESGKRRHITNPDVWESWGLTWNDIRVVAHQEIELHEEGDPIHGL